MLVLFQSVDNVTVDVSDDEELREQMDMHSIIVSCVNDEPFLTAEQVLLDTHDFWSEWQRLYFPGLEFLELDKKEFSTVMH